MRLACTDLGSDSASERGIALVLVLWVLALVSVLIFTYGLSIRSDLLIVRNQNERLQAQATADAGITLAVLRIFDPAPSGQWRADGTFHLLNYRQASIRVSVQDEHGKIDLNAAPDAFLRSLFQNLGLDPGTGESLIGEIDNFRMPILVDSASTSGAAFSSLAPRNPFLTVDELRLLPSVTPALYDKIARFVTVYSGSAQIDPDTALPEVLRSVPGIVEDEADAFLAARSAGNVASQLAFSRLTGAASLLFRSPVRVFTIYSEGMTPAGTRFIREATAALTGDPQAPYRFLTWRELHPQIAASGANPD